MAQSVTWIPPSLCGCQLKISADFTSGSVVNGVSYRHPVPFTISALEIINVCDGHKPQTQSMPDTSSLMETDKLTGKPYQQRGYLKYPIDKPTPAQCLYAFLSQYGGQTRSYSCGCTAHEFVDEQGNVTCLDKPEITKKCVVHANDTIDMKQAQIDFEKTQSVTTQPRDEVALQ